MKKALITKKPVRLLLIATIFAALIVADVILWGAHISALTPYAITDGKDIVCCVRGKSNARDVLSKVFDDLATEDSSISAISSDYQVEKSPGSDVVSEDEAYEAVLKSTEEKEAGITIVATRTEKMKYTPDPDYEKNTANLEYSHSPYDTTTNKTPDKEVYVIDVDINVNKVANSNSGDALKDAEFKVFKGATQPADTAEAWYKWDATNKKVTWVAKANADTFKTGADGKFTPAVQGLEAEKTGTAYGLLETVAPKGYNLLKDPVIVTLTGAYTEGTSGKTATVTASGADVTNGTVNLAAAQDANQPLATATVINQSGTELPSTGGIGTTIFYVIGAILVLGAGILLVTRRRMNAN